MKKFVPAVVTTVLGLITMVPVAAIWVNVSNERWPVHTVSEEQMLVGYRQIAVYKAAKYDASLRSVDYVAGGNYLNWGKTTAHRESASLKFDVEGLPMTRQGDEFEYNSVTLANFALAAHGRMLDGGKDDFKEIFLRAARKLGSIQRADGAIPNDYPYRHYTSTQPYKPGWVDGMGPGMALSVYARAFKLTGEQKWVDLGNAAFAFLQKPYPEGPMETLEDLDPSLSNRVFFAEYLAEPHVYTLNGQIFTLLGIYDWWKVTGSDRAGEMFLDGMSTLEKVLPYYDLNRFSAYDLSYITHSKVPYLKPRLPHVSAGSHAIHIAQLRALYSITQNETFKEYAEKWQGYVK